jgi:CheY-like chemotaxis protein
MESGVSQAPILLIDDDAGIREAVELVLETEGLYLVTAQNGREALEYLQHGGSARIILLDLMMPVMSGVQFREAQLRDPSIAEIPVVVLSANGAVSQTAESLGLPWLRKPISLETLLQTVAG